MRGVRVEGDRAAVANPPGISGCRLCRRIARRLCCKHASTLGWLASARGHGQQRDRGSRRATQSAAAQVHQEHRRRRFGQGWRGQVDRRGQSGACMGAAGCPGRHSRCRHLRPEPAAPAGAERAAARDPRWQVAAAAHGPRCGGDVDRLPGRRRAAHGMAWPDGDTGAHPAARRYAMEFARLPRRRHASRHRRHPADAVAAGAGERRGHRDHAPGHRAARCPQGSQDVREGRGAGARRRREHEHARLLEVRPRGAHLRGRGRREPGGPVPRAAARRAASRPSHPRVL